MELNTPVSPFYRRTNSEDYAELRDLWKMFLSPLGVALGGMFASKLSLSLESHDDLMSKAPSTVYHLLVCLWHRRMIVTEGGYIGLAPQDSEAGDEIYVVLGSPSPFILRPLDKAFQTEDQIETTPSYTVVVGNGYLHKIMFGEAFEDKWEENLETIALY